MTSIVKRSVPPPALVKMGNPLVRLLLGDSFLVLHLTGRKTGRRYDIPVGYVDMGGKLTVVTIARWRVNLRGGADVEVTLHGRLRPMHALLEEDPDRPEQSTVPARHLDARRTTAHGPGTPRRGPRVRLVGHHPHPAVTQRCPPRLTGPALRT